MSAAGLNVCSRIQTKKYHDLLRERQRPHWRWPLRMECQSLCIYLYCITFTDYIHTPTHNVHVPLQPVFSLHAPTSYLLTVSSPHTKHVYIYTASHTHSIRYFSLLSLCSLLNPSQSFEPERNHIIISLSLPPTRLSSSPPLP